MPSRRLHASAALLVTVAGCGALATSGCAKETAGNGVTASSGARSATAPTADPTGGGELSSITSLADLSAQLTAKGLTCNLEYAALKDEATGKKELSLCTVEGEVSTLVIWEEASSVTAFVKSADAANEPLAYGREWTVSTQDAAVAKKVADALGGRTAG